MSVPLVLFAEYTDIDPQPAQDLLASRGIQTELLKLDAVGLIDPAQAHAVGIIAGYSPIDAALIEQLPHLGIIAATSNGTNMIDLDAAAARGVWVTNLGTAATEEVATHALLLALAVVRELGEMTRVVAAGAWTDELESVPRRLSELTLGLVGYGRIGAQFARIAAPVFGRVLAYDPFRPPADGIAEPVTYAEVLRDSDVISLHLPLTPETETLIDASALASMRDGAVLINVSRGELVDMEACITALDSGKLSGIGFDVLVGEPPAAAHPLRTHPRALLTPHAAYLSDAALRRYQSDPARYIAEWHELGAPTESVVHAP
jgi:phosphoglycerate dehydrogenase-like enzyme